MEGLVENIGLYCRILVKSSSPEIGQWRREDLERAFHWADYFERVR